MTAFHRDLRVGWFFLVNVPDFDDPQSLNVLLRHALIRGQRGKTVKKAGRPWESSLLLCLDELYDGIFVSAWV